MQFKRKFGKLFAATVGVAAIAASLGLAVSPVFAEPDPTDVYKSGTPHITILKSNNSADPADYPDRFVAIQVFKADVNPDDNRQLSNIEWGSSIKNPGGGDSINAVLEAMVKSDSDIGTINKDAVSGGAEAFDTSPYKPYEGCTKFGQLFALWLNNNIPAVKALNDSQGLVGGSGETNASDLDGLVTAHDVAQFLDMFAYVDQRTDIATDKTEYPSPSPFTRSEVAAVFADIVAHKANLDATMQEAEGNKGADSAGKWTSYGLESGGSNADKLIETKAGDKDGDAWVIDSVKESASQGLPTGYYLVLDRFSTNANHLDQGLTHEGEKLGSVVSEHMLRVVDDDGDVLNIKADAPSLDKTITGTKDEASSQKDNSEDSNHADSVAVGDTVSYQLKGTLPENVMSYHDFKDGQMIPEYKLVFKDTTGSGLEINKDSVKIYVGTETQTPASGAKLINLAGGGDNSAEAITPQCEDKHNLTVTINNIHKLLLDNTAGGDGNTLATITDGLNPKGERSVIYVTYDAVVTKDAVTGSAASETLANKATMDFSNDPYTDGTGTTPDSKTQTYTYGLNILKRAGAFDAGDYLKAGFSLLQASGDKNAPTPAPTADHNGAPQAGQKVAWFTKREDGSYTFAKWHEPVFADEDYINWYQGGSAGSTATGVDTHHLHTGMLVYAVNAQGKGVHTKDAGGDDIAYYQIIVSNDSATELQVKGLDEGCYTVIESLCPTGYDIMQPFTFGFSATETVAGPANLSVGQTTTGADGQFTDPENLVSSGAVSDGVANLNLRNLKGIDLPITGGMGTILFYAAGAALIVGGVAYAIARKKNADADVA